MNRRFLFAAFMLATALLATGAMSLKEMHPRAAAMVSATPFLGSEMDLVCWTAEGPSFVWSKTVPTGYYLLVTDILLLPYGGTSGVWDATLWQAQGATTYHDVHLITDVHRTLADHYTTPPLWLSAGQQLKLVNSASSPGNVSIDVHGLLTTNLAYMPLVAR